MPPFCDSNSTDDSGAAMFAIVTISLFATAIGFFIAMLSFKKKQYDEWDKQGENLLKKVVGTFTFSVVSSTNNKNKFFVNKSMQFITCACMCDKCHLKRIDASIMHNKAGLKNNSLFFQRIMNIGKTKSK